MAQFQTRTVLHPELYTQTESVHLKRVVMAVRETGQRESRGQSSGEIYSFSFLRSFWWKYRRSS